MDAIVVRCKMCKHAMKFSPEKVGKRAKCPKCDAIVVIEADKKQEAEKPEPAPAAAAASAAEEEDGQGGYGVFVDPEIEALAKKRAEEEEAKKKRRRERKKLPKLGRKVRAIPEAESWEKVRLGMLFVMFGILIWIFCHVLQGSYVLLGRNDVSDFALLVSGVVEERRDEGFPPIGQGWDIDQLGAYLGMVAGREFVGYASGVIVITTCLYYIQAILWIIGYGFCLFAPRRYGMFGQILGALILAFLNMIVVFVFKFLAVVGAVSYVMIPFVVPEVCLTEYNMERMVPIHILWSGAPFWENFATIIFRSMQYWEPALFCIFTWSAGIAMKDKAIADSGHGRTQMCLGTLFILLCFHLLSLAGASPVLVIVLRVIYILWFFFALMFMVQYFVLLMKARAVLYDKINPKNELEDEEKDEDE
jgi:hypothetical protein